MNDIAARILNRTELRRRLDELHARQAPAASSTSPMRIGIEDEGTLVHVVETGSLLEAVRVFEVLGELGLEPREGRHRSGDGRRLTRLYALAAR